LGRQEWDDSIRDASRDIGSQEGVIVTSYITWVWEWECAYMFIRVFFATRFKVVITMNLLEPRS
jgi:hypothetical protein